MLQWFDNILLKRYKIEVRFDNSASETIDHLIWQCIKAERNILHKDLEKYNIFFSLNTLVIMKEKKC